jgi:hypothetical protein
MIAATTAVRVVTTAVRVVTTAPLLSAMRLRLLLLCAQVERYRNDMYGMDGTEQLITLHDAI